MSTDPLVTAAEVKELVNELGDPTAPEGHSSEPPSTNGTAESGANEEAKANPKKRDRKQRAARNEKPESGKPVFVYRMVPTKLLVFDRDREGNEEGTPVFEALRANIREVGITNPLTCLQEEKRENVKVLDGKRRAEVALLEGLEKVPCLILQKKPSKGQEYLLAATGNIHRKDWTPYECGNIFRKLLASVDGEEKKVEVAKKYGFTRSVATDYPKLADPRVKELLTEEEFENLKKGNYPVKRVIDWITACTREKDPLTFEQVKEEKRQFDLAKEAAKENKRSGKKSKDEAPTVVDGAVLTKLVIYDANPDPDTGITVVVGGVKKETPPLYEIFCAVKAWADRLEETLKKQQQESSPPPGEMVSSDTHVEVARS